ncbi:MAG: Smr/MutS family protein [Gemmatimonadaceae bacterium]|nr:Smr/MutS family protein [Gemmatimonadaceae bacterium]
MAAAFDELRFGHENTLDLRSTLPTKTEAEQRAEAFLRERQVAGAREVLVITGRGHQSEDGIPVVRPAVAARLAVLRRRGVVAEWAEHTAGSFVVVPAPVRALFEVPRRTRGPQERVVPAAPVTGLDGDTQALLRRLAVRSLEHLGAYPADALVESEMQRQFSLLSASVPDGPDREAQLRAAVMRALYELDGDL